MLEQLIQPITGPYSHSGFGNFISIKLGTLGYTSAFTSCKRARARIVENASAEGPMECFDWLTEFRGEE